MTPAAAAALAAHSGDVRLPSLKTIDVATAVALAAHRGLLDIDRIENIEPDALAALLRNRGTIDLGGLRSLGQTVTPAVLEATGSHEGALGLTGLVELPPELATAIRKHRGMTNLGPLEELSEEAARNLVGCVGDVWLDRLRAAMPEAALAALLRHRGPGKIILPSTLEDNSAVPQRIWAAIQGNRFLCIGNKSDCGLR
jgi:hypothetical protein